MNPEYICSQLVSLLHCSICLINEKGDLKRCFGEIFDGHNPINTDKFFGGMLAKRPVKEYPDIFCEHDSIFYAVIPTEEGRLIVGPVSVVKPTKELNDYMISRHFLEAEKKYQIAYCKMKDFGCGILMLYHCIVGKELSLDELWRKNELEDSEIRQVQENVSKVIFGHQEEELPHNPYDQEKREMDSIRRGDKEMLQESLRETYRGEVGRLSKNELRHVKNIAICVIVLASRAAIEGGMLPEEAFSMVDGYILKVEDMTNIVKIDALMRQAEYEFAEHVYSKHNDYQKNEIIERTKNYIFQNLHSEIIIGEIGHKIGVSTAYLSDLFHRVEGVTIQQYICQEKVRLAENLLRYSGYDIKDIAAYLSFCTQSYFGHVFKSHTGMTPTKYRKKFGKFHENENQ